MLVKQGNQKRPNTILLFHSYDLSKVVKVMETKSWAGGRPEG